VKGRHADLKLNTQTTSVITWTLITYHSVPTAVKTWFRSLFFIEPLAYDGAIGSSNRYSSVCLSVSSYALVIVFRVISEMDSNHLIDIGKTQRLPKNIGRDVSRGYEPPASALQRSWLAVSLAQALQRHLCWSRISYNLIRRRTGFRRSMRLKWSILDPALHRGLPSMPWLGIFGISQPLSKMMVRIHLKSNHKTNPKSQARC
jgi:hypothetical protein